MTIKQLTSSDYKVSCCECPVRRSQDHKSVLAQVSITLGSKTVNLCFLHGALLVKELERLYLIACELQELNNEMD